VSVLLMGINQKQLIAVSILNRKIILDVGLRRETSLNAIDFQRFFRLTRNSCFCVCDFIFLLVVLSSFAIGLALYFVLSVFFCACWAVCLVCVFCLFWYSLFSKQLAINSYMPFNNSIIGFKAVTDLNKFEKSYETGTRLVLSF
jgi:hypothetical protein